MTASIAEKAARLLATGQVEPETAPATVYTVRGDHGSYLVVVGPHIAVCTCPAPARCAHIEAAVGFELATDEQRAEILARLNARKARDAAEADAIFARLESNR